MTDEIKFEVTEKPLKVRLCTQLVNASGDGALHWPTTPAEFDAVARKRGYFTHQWISDIQDILFEQSKTTSEDIRDTLRRIIAERNEARRMNVEVFNTEKTCHIDGVTYRGNEETIGKMDFLRRRNEVLEKESARLSDEKADLKRQLGDSQDKRSQWRVACEDAQRQLAEAKELLTKALDRAEDNAAKCNSYERELTKAWDRVRELEGKSSPPIHDKWRKAIDQLSRCAWTATTATHDRIGYAVRELGHAQVSECDVKQHVLRATEELLWLAAELEKGPSNG